LPLLRFRELHGALCADGELRLLGWHSGRFPDVSVQGFDQFPSTVPRRLKVGFILPRAERPLQSSFSLLSSLSRSTDPEGSIDSRRAPRWVASSLIATWARGVHSVRGAPNSSLRSVLGVSHALDGLLRHVLCGLVSSHSHVQGFPFRDSTETQSRAEFSPAVALLPFPPTPLQPESCASAMVPGFKALLPASRATVSDGRLDPSERRVPLGISPPPGLPDPTP
jgi:hypothetical protein